MARPVRAAPPKALATAAAGRGWGGGPGQTGRWRCKVARVSPTEGEDHMAGKTIAENRRARFDYFLEQTFEAGLALTGSEVKSLRNGRANIAESYVAVQGDEIMLVNADIPPYAQAGPHFNHEPRRHRKLLLNRKEIDRLKARV